MVRIRENWQKQLTSHRVAMGLLRTELGRSTLRMFVCIIDDVLQVNERAP